MSSYLFVPQPEVESGECWARLDPDELMDESAALLGPHKTPPAQEGCCARLAQLGRVVGPGLVVMLADTDVGSLVTAAQSGAQWGYSLVWLQVALIPILFVTQSLTVRLGLATGRGHGELIRASFGAGWAWLSVGTLVLACGGAIICQMSGIAAVGSLVHLPPWASVGMTVLFLLTVVCTGSYKSVERVAIMIGCFELVFLVTMFASPVDLGPGGEQLFRLPSQSSCYHGAARCWSDYLQIATANIGAVIMPWMIFYQQSAVVDKGLTARDLPFSTLDTAVGSAVTQLIMVALLVTTAATLWSGELGNNSAPLESITDVTNGLVDSALGQRLGRTPLTVLLSLGILGASLVASIVVSLTAAWGLGEVAGYKRSLENNPSEAPWFYVVYALILAAGAGVTLSPVSSVSLNVAIQIMNAALLPVVLGLLFALAVQLEGKHRLRGPLKWIVAAVFTICSIFGLAGAALAVVEAIH